MRQCAQQGSWKGPGLYAYGFSTVEDDLLWLSGRGKKLFVELQDVSFDESVE